MFVVLVDLEAPELSNQDDRQAQKKQYIIHKGDLMSSLYLAQGLLA